MLGDHQSARGFARRAVELTSGRRNQFTELFCRYALAHAYASSADDAADSEIDQGVSMSRTLNAPLMEYAFELLKAMLALHRGDTARADTILLPALAKAKLQRFRCYLGWVPAVMTRLFSYALEREFETKFVRECIDAMPEAFSDPLDFAAWWPGKPRVVIVTMGSFRILVDGKPLEVAGGRPTKVLELLAALIAFDCREIPAEILDVRERSWPMETLRHKLWPQSADPEGALKERISELRKRIGVGNDLVVQYKGVYRLNPLYCQVDLWSLLRAIRRWGASDGRRRSQVMAAIKEHYRGDFLAGINFSSRSTNWLTTVPHQSSMSRPDDSAGIRERLREYFARFCRNLD